MQIGKFLNTDFHLGKLFPKCSDLGIGVLGKAVGFAFHLVGWWHNGAPSRNGIRCVLLGISHIKVIRIYTAWPVTLMKAIKSYGDWAIMEFIRKAVCSYCAPIDSDLPVPVLIAATCPIPTAVWPILVDLCPEAVFGWTDRPIPDRVTNDKANRFARYMPKSGIIADRNGSRLPTAALAKAGWIGRLHLFLSSVMPIDIAKRFTFNPTGLFAAFVSQFGLLSTATMAISVRDFVCGFVRGKICHVRRSFQRLNVPGDVATSARFCFASL